MDIEQLIWQQLFEVAKGLKTVEDAAEVIFESIPSSFENVDNETRSWFLISMKQLPCKCTYIY